MSLTDKMSDSEEAVCFIGARNFLVFSEFEFVAAVSRKRARK